MLVKYIGIHPEVRYRKMIFKKGEEKVLPEGFDIPQDFEIIGKEKPKFKKMSIDSLIDINGIGEETIKDIKRKYNNLESLKIDLKTDKAPFRNDVVKQLKNKLLR